MDQVRWNRIEALLQDALEGGGSDNITVLVRRAVLRD